MSGFKDSAGKLAESAKDFASSFKDVGSNAVGGAKGLAGFTAAVAVFGAKVAGFFARIPMFFARKGLDLGAAANRNPVTGTIIGAGIIGGALYGAYKTLKYALGYREESKAIEAVGVEQQLMQERQKGAMLNANLEQAAAHDMYASQGNWANSVGGKPAATYQQQVSEQAAAAPTTQNR